MTQSPFIERFRREPYLLGTFIKTPTCHATEILGSLGFDFVIVDEEHAPIDRWATDQIMLACRATGIAGLVRVAEPGPSDILSALDCGAQAVLVPHVCSAHMARQVAQAGRYRDGGRGFSGSPRAGGYGAMSLAQHVAQADASTAIIAMIEDRQAIDAVDAILSVDGIDAVFIGRADLAVSYGVDDSSADSVEQAVGIVIGAARRIGKPVMMAAAGAAEAWKYAEQGATAFVVSSDQGLMRQAASATHAAFDALKARQGG